MKSFVRQHPLVTYFVLTYILSWSIFIPLALIRNGVIKFSIPFSIYYIASYGPLLAALITTRLVGGSQALKELLGRIINWHIPRVWWLVSLSPLLFFALTIVFVGIWKGEWFDLNLVGQIEFMPDLGVAAFPLWLLTYGIGEETGWRGFALPRLQENRSALGATVFLWIFIAIWHAPAFFLVYDPAILPGFLPGLLAGAIVFTWLYNSTNGSILTVTLFHGAFNFVTASRATKAGIIAAIISTIVVLWSVVVVILFKPTNLSRRERQSA